MLKTNADWRHVGFSDVKTGMIVGAELSPFPIWKAAPISSSFGVDFRVPSKPCLFFFFLLTDLQEKVGKSPIAPIMETN